MRSTGDKSLGLNPGTTDYASDSPVKAGEWNHFAFSFNKRAFKGYVNGFRVINVPSMEAPGYFYFSSNGYYRYSGISNVRICEGAVPLYDRLISNGKIVTYNITFETGKADLKEESIIELQRIATLMAQYSDLELVVEGHTDNTGSASTNDEISMKRAENVVDHPHTVILYEHAVCFGASSRRLEAVRGDHLFVVESPLGNAVVRIRGKIEFLLAVLA